MAASMSLNETCGSGNEKKTLSRNEVMRYSRQLILPEIGVKGQENLKKTSVLVVGAGGLGCPVAIYLAAAGIGKLGIVDYDEVEVNNLHRQVLHSETDVGVSKAESVKRSVLQLNGNIECLSYQLLLNSKNALVIVNEYDIVVDATDNVPTRYLLNDACVILKKPLVSGSALRFEGQLTIYNHDGGPCYRCLYPVPPPPETVTNCSDGGVLGPVPGIIGTMQALEVIKLAAGLQVSYSNTMLLFDGLGGTFRNIRLRSRQKNCIVCGEDPKIMELIDYELFCGMKASDKEKQLVLLSENERISCKVYDAMVKDGVSHLLVDVREPVELGICSLPNSYNLPLTKMENEDHLKKLRDEIKSVKKDENKTFPVIVLCRRGNDSQLAVRSLRSKLNDLSVSIVDISGGLYSWADDIDPEFPLY